MTTASPIERAIQAAGGPEAFLERLSSQDKEALLFRWPLWARPSQLPPSGDWLTWLIVAGRGHGKTRTGAETIRSWLPQLSIGRIALLGRTPADVRDVMIEGESGILNIFPPDERPEYMPSMRRLLFKNGAQATTYSSENPDQLRGPQHEAAWTDELATFKSSDAWDNLQLGLRLGNPRQIVTTTPRPIRMIRELVKDEDTVITKGTTYENRANLARAFFRQVIRRYEGTRRGQQELMGVLLDDVPGALWQRQHIRYKEAPAMERVVVAVDPSVGEGEDIAECGIVVVGKGVDGHFYVLLDKSLRASPNRWAQEVISAYYSQPTDRIVAEVNNGGKLVELTLRTLDKNIPYTAVSASVGKDARAEPVSALYEQGRVFHVTPFEDLEDQLCTWVPREGKSPDRLDALVWGLYELAIKREWSVVI